MESSVSKKESPLLMAVNIIAFIQFIGIVGGYRYGGNSFEIYEKVFGTMNPFAERLEDDGKD
jgi:hypothetical protein